MERIEKLKDKETATAYLEWDRRWKTEEGRNNWLDPEPEVIAVTRRLRNRGVSRVLDLGCGVGRHSILLASLGFSVVAFDASSNGIAFARSRAKADGIFFLIGLMSELPFGNCSFDYVLAWNVIYHGNRSIVGQSLREIRRILKPGGFFQGTMLSKTDHRYGRGRAIEPDTYISEGEGHPHFFCNASGLAELFAEFDLIRLVDCTNQATETNHWHFLVKRI